MEVRLAALVPTVGDPRRLLDQLAGQPRRAVEVAVVDLLVDGRQPPLVVRRADAPPDADDRTFGERPHAAVEVDQRPAEHRVRPVVGQPAQGEDGAAPRRAIAVFDEPLERADQVVLDREPQKRGDIVIDEILLVELDQQRNLVEVVAHGS